MPFENIAVRLPGGPTFGPAPMNDVQQWTREGRIPPHAILIDAATGEERTPMSFRELAPLFPATVLNASAPTYPANDTVSSIIPYNNPKALTAYYLGIFSILCYVGVILGPIALGLGLAGLQKAKTDPLAKGTVHAWIGIVCGAIFGLGNIVLCIFTLIAVVMK